MTLLDQPQAQTTPSVGRQGGGASHDGRSHGRRVNVGPNERAVSVAAGGILALLGLSRASLPGLLVAGVGGAMIYRGATGHCHLYGALGVDTSQSEQGAREPTAEESTDEHGIHVEQAFLINRSAEDLYRYWRNFENLPAIMTHLKSVEVIDDRRSHWVATAPTVVGGKVEWDAEITQDNPNSGIAWRSQPGSDVDMVGTIRFSKAPGDRGTEVHVSLDYVPPAGRVGHWVAKLFGESPRRQMREDLRRFKQLMETGEIPSLDGQPHGTCTGRGVRYKDSQ